MFGHLAEFADGWLPIGSSGIKAALPATFEAAGRDPDTARVVL